MDGSNFDPNQKLRIKNEPDEMEMESVPSPPVPEPQRYTPEGSPKYHSEQKNVSGDYDVSPMPESPEPLPDDCPDWFLPWLDFYETLANLDGYFEKPANQKTFLDGKGFGYNATVLTLIKWDAFPEEALTPDQIDEVDEWIQSSLQGCPIPLEDIPRKFNHRNRSFKPSTADRKQFFETEDEREAAAIQKEEKEFVPEWMKDTVILGLSPQDAFREYWDERNNEENYKPGANFLTPEKLRQDHDALYCWLAKFRDMETGRDAGLRDDQIELVWARLEHTDNTVNKVLLGKKKVEIYNWNTMRLVDTEQERDHRTRIRLQELGNTPQIPMEVLDRPLEYSESEDDFTVKIPLSQVTIQPSSNQPPVPADDEMDTSETSTPLFSSSESDESRDSDTEYKPAMKRSRGKRPKSSAKIPKKEEHQSPSSFTELPTDLLPSPAVSTTSSKKRRSSKSLSRQTSHRSTTSSKSDSSSPPFKRRSSLRKSVSESRPPVSSTPQASGSSSPETVRKKVPTDNISFDTESSDGDELPTIKDIEDLEGVKFPGVFQDLSEEEQQKLLDAKDTEWLKRTRFQHFPENPGAW